MKRQLLAIYILLAMLKPTSSPFALHFLLFRKVTFYLGVLLCQLRSLRHLAGEC